MTDATERLASGGSLAGSFAERQRRRLAAGQFRLAATFADLEGRSPAVRAYAEELLERAAEMPAPTDPVAVASAVRRAVADLHRRADGRRARQEIADLARRDHLDDADRQRVLEIARWRRAADRARKEARR